MTSVIAGLSSIEASRRLTADGPNQLPEPRRPSALRHFGKQFTHLLAILLWVASGLALLAGQPSLAVAIVVVIVLNAIFAFAQEYRADRSAERLRSLLPMSARVRRDGQLRVIDATQLVRGDLVVLRSGDRISADLTLTVSHSLAVDESMVSGESVAVRHAAGELVVAGTFVVQGEGEGVVNAIGAHTTIAGIAALTRQAHRPPSPLTVQLNRVVKIIAVIAIIAGALLGMAGLGMGLAPTQAFLFAVGVAVALVPEGLLPTVTLSLARGASLMAGRNALVRHLDAVETLGATTYICTDKTGTLTQNRMAVVEVWTPAGTALLEGTGYEPTARIQASPEVVDRMRRAAQSAVQCVSGRVVQQGATWIAEGDAMEAAVHAWSLRLGGLLKPEEPIQLRLAYTADRMLSSVVIAGRSIVLGAPEAVLSRCLGSVPLDVVNDLAERGRRVLAVAEGAWHPGEPDNNAETGLTLLALIGFEDPPRPDIAEALAACRTADIKVAMITGDHPGTAAAVAREVGLLGERGIVLDASRLPTDDEELAACLDREDGAVVARVTPGQKLRIARVLRQRGHVVAMTGDGVNDAPVLREADVGVAMGLSGSDVTKAAADLVLLDDHFATIVNAIELGRATFANVRRFLTYHLTDNVAELAPFAAWALTGGNLPLAIGVLQILALDIGTDMLPALALGAEPPNRRILSGRVRQHSLIDGRLLGRALLVLGVTEAVCALTTFVAVLSSRGWTWGATPAASTLAIASGSAFAAIALGQMANAFACRSETQPVWRQRLGTNRLLIGAVTAELVLLGVFLGVPPLARLLGGSWPSTLGWALAFCAVPILIIVDASYKALRRSRSRQLALASVRITSGGRR
jgi:magnesium-transporting ATPase (P-type)